VSGLLIVVATPIGNLGDLSSRALEVLRSATVVYCEDTRHSRQIFSAHHISSAGRLRSLHEHNEAALCDEIVARVARGELVALISDAGTPTVSDPGERVVAAVADAGHTVTTAPGPSAVIAALSVSGLATDRFVMEGFLPRRGSDRSRRIDILATEQRTTVIYEAPGRLVATLLELNDRLGHRRAVVARELTKLHEEVARGTLSELAQHFGASEVRGEVVVVIEGAPAPAEIDDATLIDALEVELRIGATLRDAASSVARTLDAPHRRVYQLALDIRRAERA
jgi:16S rRNA (cytidine1402-2'-O)-methyltransferase